MNIDRLLTGKVIILYRYEALLLMRKIEILKEFLAFEIVYTSVPFVKKMKIHV